MKKTFIAFVALFSLSSIFIQPTFAASDQGIKIPLLTTWKIAQQPGNMPIPLSTERFSLTFNGSTNMIPAQSKLYWIDKKFKIHGVALNSKISARPSGVVEFNNRYFFTANMGVKSTNLQREILSIDSRDKIRKWQIPGYQSCAIAFAMVDYLYIACSKISQRAKSYNPNRQGSRSAVWIYDIETLFTISKSDQITKIATPVGRTLDLVWLGDHQILVQSDSIKDERQLSYYYLENGTLTYAFDLPDTVGIMQLTSAGWTLQTADDINAPLFACPARTVLGADGQFLKLASPPACYKGIPDQRAAALVFGGALTDGSKWQDQKDSECNQNLRGKSVMSVGFFNGHVLCYDNFETGDNAIHAYPSTYKAPELPKLSFPVINQKSVPGPLTYSPEATTPMTGNGFPTSCPEVDSSGSKNEPLVVGFEFDATHQHYLRVGEGTARAVSAPASLVGCYIDFETLLQSPGGNSWAIGSISHDETGYYWTNAFGLKWGLKLSGSKMNTDKDNPYYSDGHQFILQSNFPPKAEPKPSPELQAAGVGATNWAAKCPAVMDTVGGAQPKISGYKFDGAYGENFARLVDGGFTAVSSPSNLLGCYADIPSLNGPQGNSWHVGTINRDETGFYWLNAAGVRWGLTLSGSVLITDKNNPYYSKGFQFITY